MHAFFEHRRLAQAVVLTAFAMPVLAAAPNKQDEQKLIAKVFSDGTLFGFAKRCQLPEADLKALYDKQFASSREIGMAKVPTYSAKHFRRDFQTGINTANRFAASSKAGAKARERECVEVREKVRSIVRGK